MNTKKIVLIIAVVLIIGLIASMALGVLGYSFFKEIKENPIIENEDKEIIEESIIDIGEIAPNFTLKDLNGNEVSLSDYAGEKIVLLNFWASWCPPCREEMPDLDKLYQENKDDDFVVLAVNVGETEKIVKDFMTEKGYSFPVLLDRTQEVGITYNTFSIPTSVMVDKEGKIRVYRPGLMTYAEMKDMLDHVRGQ